MTNQSKFKITVAVTAFLILVILIYASHKYGFAFQYKWDAGSNGWTKSKYHKKKANEENRTRNMKTPDMYARAIKTLKGYCGGSLYNETLLHFRSHDHIAHLSRVHLLVTLNTPFWQNITFCSVAGNKTMLESLRKSGYHIITYSLPNTTKKTGNGWLAYRCWTELVEGGFLSHKNSGVLGINDDQIISPLGMLNLNINNIWRVGSRGGDGIFDLKTGKTCRKGNCSYPRSWMWWGGRHLNRYNGSLWELRDRAEAQEQPYMDCHRQLVNVTGGDLRMVGGHTADIYYVPNRYLHQYATIVKIFFKHLSFVEATVTTVLSCLENSTETQQVLGVNIWGGARYKKPWINFQKFKTKKVHFYHPVKWSHLMKKTEADTVANFTDFLCNSVIPHLYNLTRTTTKSLPTQSNTIIKGSQKLPV